MMELLNLLWGLVSNFFFLRLGINSSKEGTTKIIKAIQDVKELGLDKSITQRIQSLDDYWEGIVNQQDGPDGEPIKLSITVRLEVNSLQNIRANFWYYWSDVKTTLEAEGQAVDNRIIVLQFKDANKRVIRFGTFMFDFDHLGESLDGHFVAYAAERKAIVTGSVTLYRRLRQYDRQSY
jgi:hypothetical protein